MELEPRLITPHTMYSSQGGGVGETKKGGCAFCTVIKKVCFGKYVSFFSPSGPLLSSTPNLCGEPGTFKCTGFRLKRTVLSAPLFLVTQAPTLPTDSRRLRCLASLTSSHSSVPSTPNSCLNSYQSCFFSRKIKILLRGEGSHFLHLPLTPPSHLLS